MITADEAAKQSMLVIYKHETEELKRIEDGIKSRIALGEREYNYDGYISQNAKKKWRDADFQLKLDLNIIKVMWLLNGDCTSWTNKLVGGVIKSDLD